MKNKLILVLAGIISYLLFLIFQFPAQMAWEWAPAEVKKELRLQGLDGSIWKGQAQQAWLQRHNLGRVEWSLSFFSLLTGSPSVDFIIDAPGIQASGRVSGSDTNQLELTDTRAIISPELLDSQLTPFQLRGNLGLDISKAEFDRDNRLNVSGVASLGDGSLEGPSSLPLGDVSAVLKPVETQTEISIENKDSPLGISGIVNLDASGHYELDFRFRNKNPARQDISDALSFLGKPDAAGNYPFAYRGVLPF